MRLRMELQHQIEALYHEAQSLKAAGRLAESEEVEAKAAELLESLKSRVEREPESLETATALLFLSDREWLLRGDHPDLQTRIERALAIRESHLGREAPAVAAAVAQLAEFHFLAGRLGEAEPLYRRAIAILDGHPAAGDPLYGRVHGGLAQILAAYDRPAEADLPFAKAIVQAEGPQGDKKILYFLYIHRAEGLEKLGRPEEAEALRRKALSLLPKNNPGESGFHV